MRSVYSFSALCAVSTTPRTPAASASAVSSVLAELRIHFLEVASIDEDLTGLAPGPRRHEPLGLHHVDEPRGAAEADAEPSLQKRNRGLAAANDDASRLVVQIVLLKVNTAGSSLLVLRGNRIVEHGLTLLAQEAG